jgi:hypothetical protein
MSAPIEASRPENQPYGLMDNTIAFLLTFGTPFLSTLMAVKDVKISLISLAAGEITARILYIKGKPNNNSTDNLPKRPLAAENPPVTVVSFKTAGFTA